MSTRNLEAVRPIVSELLTIYNLKKKNEKKNISKKKFGTIWRKTEEATRHPLVGTEIGQSCDFCIVIQSAQTDGVTDRVQINISLPSCTEHKVAEPHVHIPDNTWHLPHRGKNRSTSETHLKKMGATRWKATARYVAHLNHFTQTGCLGGRALAGPQKPDT